MALFKILQGSSEDLKNLKATEGYAYFTPDDGKFYIDVDTTATAAEVVVGESSANGVNRICINTGKPGGGVQSIIIDASPDAAEGFEVVYDCIIPAGTPDEDIAIIDCNPQQ